MDCIVDRIINPHPFAASTKGLWISNAPLRSTTLDGTDYNLLLLDSESINAYDQTSTYNTQIFSLEVLLSSMFVYNQMGGIDEATLDRLYLVTEMKNHIRVRTFKGLNHINRYWEVISTLCVSFV